MPTIKVLNELQIKQNGVTATYKLGTVNGYYKVSNGKFYEESTYVTEIEGAPNLVYADIGGNNLYIWKTSTSSFVKVSGIEGGGTANDNLKFGYLNSADGKFYEDDEYLVEIEGDPDYLFITLDDEKIYRYDQSTTSFVMVGGTDVPPEIVFGYYNAEDGKFYKEDTFTTEIEGDPTKIFVDKGNDTTYRYDETEGFISVGGGGGSGSYEAGFGIDIANDTIKTTDFVGTQAEWDALTATEKEVYDFIHIIDDTTNVNYSPGHAISDGTGEKTQREVLEFNGFNVTDDSVNGKTKIAEVPYTAGKGVEITNKEIAVDENIRTTFVGTQTEWNALTTEEKAEYEIVNITDDPASGAQIVVDEVTEGNMNAVTSNAVYDTVEEINSNLAELRASAVDYSSVVDISTYTSYAGSFIVPADGIVQMILGAAATNRGAIGIREGIDILAGYGNASGTTIYSMIVRKGMGVMTHYNQGTGNTFRYLPFK